MNVKSFIKIRSGGDARKFYQKIYYYFSMAMEVVKENLGKGDKSKI